MEKLRFEQLTEMNLLEDFIKGQNWCLNRKINEYSKDDRCELIEDDKLLIDQLDTSIESFKSKNNVFKLFYSSDYVWVSNSKKFFLLKTEEAKEVYNEIKELIEKNDDFCYNIQN